MTDLCLNGGLTAKEEYQEGTYWEQKKRK